MSGRSPEDIEARRHTVSARLSATELGALERLVELGQSSRSEVLRRLILEAVEREDPEHLAQLETARLTRAQIHAAIERARRELEEP